MLTVVCQKIVIPQTDCYVPSYRPVTRLQDKKITIPRVICPSDFSSNTFAPSFALANWLDARLIPDGTTCITIIGHRGKHILSQSFSDHYKRTLLKFAGCHLRAQSPTGFPMIRRANALRTLATLLQASHAVVALIIIKNQKSLNKLETDF